MGSKQSKSANHHQQHVEKGKNFVETVKANVETEIARRMMIQREVQMAVNIAKARDNLYIFGSLWLTLTTGVTTATLLKKPVPHVAFVPVVVGGVLLGNLADMAYGNKLARVNKEAEHILANERPRFVPFPQAPFAKFYSAEERSILYDPATAVGDLPPYSSLTRSLVPKKK
jgi:hypothetical protein